MSPSTGTGSPLRKLRSNLGLWLYRRRHCNALFQWQADNGTTLSCIADIHASIGWRSTYTGAHHPQMIRRRLPSWPPRAATLRNLARAHGVVLMPGWAVPKSLRGEVLLHEPYVEWDVPLPPTLAEYRQNLGRSAQSDISRLERGDWRARFSTAPDWAETFFRDFHEPTMRTRHGDEGYCVQPAELRKTLALPGGEWLQIWDEDRIVAATLVSCVNGERRLHQLGWLKGDADLLQRGAAASVVWFNIVRAYELGQRCFQLGGTRGMLGFGVAVSKTKWNARIRPFDDRPLPVSVLLNPAHPAVRTFFSRKAVLLAGTDEHPLLALSADAPRDVTGADRQRASLSHWFRLRPAPGPVDSIARMLLPASLAPWVDRMY